MRPKLPPLRCARLAMIGGRYPNAKAQSDAKERHRRTNTDPLTVANESAFKYFRNFHIRTNRQTQLSVTNVRPLDLRASTGLSGLTKYANGKHTTMASGAEQKTTALQRHSFIVRHLTDELTRVAAMTGQRLSRQEHSVEPSSTASHPAGATDPRPMGDQPTIAHTHPGLLSPIFEWAASS